MGKFTIEFKWAVIFSVATLIWTAIEKAVGLHDEHISKHALYTNIFAIIAILIFLFALREKKVNYYHNVMNWSQGFLSGVIMSVFIAILSPLVIYTTFTYITPDFFANAIEYGVSNGYPRDRAIAYFTMNSYMLQGAFGSLSMGIVTAAVVSLFLRTKKDTPNAI